MPFYDRLNIGSIFREPRGRPARFNPAFVRVRIREISRQLARPRLRRFGGQGMLPPRGTGLVTGRAGPRRYGRPRTDAERRARHFTQPLPPKHKFKGFKA